jgi:hypothetical protein
MLPSLSYAEESPEELFERYEQLAKSFDSSIGSLYFDDAKVHAYRVYPHGLERTMEFTGAEWKEFILKVMPMAKSQNDISTYSNIVITEVESGYKIKADRYSERKCYTDNGYYMIVKSDVNGELLISEEYLETKPMPNC